MLAAIVGGNKDEAEQVWPDCLDYRVTNWQTRERIGCRLLHPSVSDDEAGVGSYNVLFM